MQRVTGIGGIFFKSEDPRRMYEWYEKHLGIKGSAETGAFFPWRCDDDPERKAMTIWSIFPAATKYFKQSRAGFMINYRVENLDALLEELRREGVEIDPERQNHEYGRFAWITDPDGNRIELWEPPQEEPKQT